LKLYNFAVHWTIAEVVVALIRILGLVSPSEKWQGPS